MHIHIYTCFRDERDRAMKLEVYNRRLQTTKIVKMEAVSFEQREIFFQASFKRKFPVNLQLD